MNTKPFLLVSLSLFLSNNYVDCQYSKVEEESFFKSRIDNPIKIEPLSKGKEYVFFAINRSFYPYQLRINFTELINLTPMILNRSYTLLPGRNNLFFLTIKDINSMHSYKYSISYSIGKPSENVEENFPYLIPIGLNKKFQMVNHPVNYSILLNYFKINPGDTVYNMRKGFVVAVPDMFHDADRVSNRKSLEVMHADGTVAIYENIDPDQVLVKPGKTIYPGQPLGKINETAILEVYLYRFLNEGKIKPVNIKYYINQDRTEEFSERLMNITYSYPIEIIQKEMTGREVRKLKSK